jgi:hypothetical protein
MMSGCAWQTYESFFVPTGLMDCRVKPGNDAE